MRNTGDTGTTAPVTLGVTMADMGTRRFSVSAREEIHDRIRAHAEAAAADVSTYLIAAAIQQMIRDDQAAASFATIDSEITPGTKGSAKVALPVPAPELLADYPDTRTGERVVYYDAGMLLALLASDARARAAHEVLKASPHRPVVTGPVLSQVWRESSATAHALSAIVGDCTILQAKDDIGPIRGLERGVIGCLPCHRVYRRADFQRAGQMLGKARLPAKNKPDAVGALVIVAAAWHGPSLVLTSDPEDLLAYRAVLDTPQIEIMPVS